MGALEMQLLGFGDAKFRSIDTSCKAIFFRIGLGERSLRVGPFLGATQRRFLLLGAYVGLGKTYLGHYLSWIST